MNKSARKNSKSGCALIVAWASHVTQYLSASTLRKTVGVLLLPSFSLAATGPSSLEQMINDAQSKSPEIRGLRNQVESAQAKSRLALAPTEPTFSLLYNDMDYFVNPNFSGSTVYQLVQPFAFPGKALVNRAIQSKGARSLEAQLHAMELQVSTNVKLAVYQLAQAQENIKLNLEQKSAYDRILAIAKRRYEAGAITQVDLMNAQVAIYSNQNDLTDLQSTERSARAQLNVLLNRPPDSAVTAEPVKMVALPLITERDAVEKMLAHRNEIASARLQVEASESSVTLAKMAALPDFQVTGGVTYYNQIGASPLSSSTGANKTYLFGLQMTIPLWFLFNERETISAAAHDRNAAQANLDTLLNQSKVALDNALESVTAAQKKIETFEQHLLPLAEQSLKLALINYSSGKIDYQTLTDTATARRNAHQNYTSAIVTYLSAYANLSQLLGEEIPNVQNPL